MRKVTQFGVLCLGICLGWSAFASAAVGHEQCVQDICGRPESLAPVHAIVPMSLKRELINSIDPILNSLVEMDVKKTRRSLEAANGLLAKGKQQGFDDTMKAFFTFYAVQHLTGNQVQNFIEGPNVDGTSFFNAAKFQQTFPHLPKAQAERIAKIWPVLIATSGWSWTGTVWSISYDLFVHAPAVIAVVGPSGAKQTDTIHLAEFIKQQSDALSHSLDPALISLMVGPPSLISKAVRGAALTDNDKQKLMSAFANVYVVNDILAGDLHKVLIENPIDLIEFAKQQHFERNLARLRSRLEDLNLRAALVKKLRNQCYANANARLFAAPSTQQIQQALALSESVKTAAQKALPLFFDGQDLTAARAALLRTTFSPPIALNEMQAMIVDRLNSGVSDAQVNLNLASATAQSPNWQGALLMAFSILDDPTDNHADFEYLSQTYDVCDALKPPELLDLALTAEGAVQMSWQSALFPQYGAGIMAHELGHIVSAATKNSMSMDMGPRAGSDLRSCQARCAGRRLCRSRAVTKKKIGPTHFHLRSLKFYAKLGLMLEILLVRWWMSTLTLAITRDLDFKMSDSAQAHSSNLHRLIQIQSGLGDAMPASCLQAAGNAASRVVNSCSP